MDLTDNASAEQSLHDQIIVDLEQDPSHIVPVYALIQRRKRAKLDSDEDILKGASPLDCSTIRGLPDDTKISWIASRCDLSHSDMVKMLAADRESLDTLLSLGLQMNIAAKLPDKLLFEEPLEVFLDSRYEQCGKRLEDLKAKGGVRSDWTLELKIIGPYSFEFDNDIMTSIVHCSGAKAKVLPEHHLTRKHKLRDNIGDFQAVLILEPLPAVHLHSFFAQSKTGPYECLSFVGKPKELVNKFDEAYSTWEKRARAALKGGQKDERLVHELNEHYTKMKQESMQKARRMAKSVLEASKLKKTISRDS